MSLVSYHDTASPLPDWHHAGVSGTCCARSAVRFRGTLPRQLASPKKRLAVDWNGGKSMKIFLWAGRPCYDVGVSDFSRDNFGALIAYLVPGATILWGLSEFSPVLRGWFASTPPDAPTLGGFLYLTVASLAAGMTVSAVRWTVMDKLHSLGGVKPPLLDFSLLGPNVEAFMLLIEIHYRHYLFYANQFVATAFAYVCYRLKLGGIWPMGIVDGGFVIVEMVFLAMSRDTLWKYYTRSEQLLRVKVDSARNDGGYSIPTSFKKSGTEIRYARQKAASSTTSMRRSPDSHLETNDA